MYLRSFGRAVFTSLLLSSASISLVGFVMPVAAIAAPQASSTAVQATELALKGRFADAGAMAEQSSDAAAVKLVELLYLKDHWKDAGYARIMDFLNAAPKWPLTETLLKRAEQALYSNREPANITMAHFEKRVPVTPEGNLALARAELETGNATIARSLVQKVWNDADLDATMEKSVLAEFGGLLTIDDHRRRMWRMVYAQSPNGAIRMSKKLGGDYQAAAKVAQSLLRGVSGAEKQFAALPSAMREQLGMKYALVNYNRRLERYAKARSILVTVPGNAAAMGDADAWWVERRIVARHSVGVSHADSTKAAYQIAKSHGFADGANAVEAEFLAGWIALRYMKDADTALKHFNKLAEVAPSRTEKARAAYWIGRSLLALGDKGNARAAFQDASQHSTIYYGQLAREQIGLAKVPEEVRGGTPTSAALAKVEGDEVVRAFNLVAKANGKSSLNMFVWSMASRFDRVDDMNAVASITKQLGGTTMALRLAKAAGQRNVDIDYWSYPTQALPKWPQMGRPIERALVFGLSRQESEFDPNAGSKVGAQGLMQIMPSTARLIAKQYRLPYTPSKLMGDPTYNVKLGAAHLADLVENFNGSYILTLVAYNAGPRRAKEWVAEYGDPRGGQVDPIDWVESIPFQETRQYVQKVLQNTHVYRARLAPDTVHAMSLDLKRGTPAEVTVAATDKIESAAACSSYSIAALIKSCD